MKETIIFTPINKYPLHKFTEKKHSQLMTHDYDT